MTTATEAPELEAGVAETPTTQEAPGAPEATSEVPPVPASDELAQSGKEPATSARLRDDKGRFTKADGSPAQDPALAASPPPATPDTAPAPVAVATEPAWFRGAGQRHQIPGSTVSPEGHWTIPAEYVPNLRQLLASGVDYQQNGRRREAEFQKQLQERDQLADAKAAKYNDASVYLYDLIADPQKLQSLIEHPERIELVKERLQLMLQRHDLHVPAKAAPRQEQETADPGADLQRIEAAARDTLSGYLEELLETPQAKAVYDTPEKRDKLIARYQRRLNAYINEQDGQFLLHENAVEDDFKDDLDSALAIQKAREEERKAAEFNARRNAPPAAIPPVVSTKAPPATTPATGSAPTSRDDWRKRNGLN